MTTTEATYIAACEYTGAAEYDAIVLFRAPGESTWSEVCRNTQGAVEQRFFTGIHGLADSSFLVAVGGYGYDGRSLGIGVLSYSYDGATWIDYAVPSNMRLQSVYVPEVDFAWVTGRNDTTGDTCVWAWTPTDGFTFEVDMTPPGRSGQVSHIHGVSKLSGVFASCKNSTAEADHFHRTGGEIGSGSWTQYTSPGGSYGGGCYLPTHAVRSDLAYGNGLDGGHGSCLAFWDGSWTYSYKVDPGSTTCDNYGVCAWDGGFLMTCQIQSKKYRIWKWESGVGWSIVLDAGDYGSRLLGLRIANNGTDTICIGDNRGTPGIARFWESDDQGDTWGSTQTLTGYHYAQDALFTYPYVPPQLVPVSPLNGGLNFSIEGGIVFNLTCEVALSANWIVEVNNGAGWVQVLSFVGGPVWSGGYSGTVTDISNGYRVSLQPGEVFPYETSIQVRVSAANIYGTSVVLVP